MISLRELRVADWATWRSGVLRLDQPGVHFVRGKNADAGGNSNGVGKSSFFNALFALNFGDHQLAVRRRSLKSSVRDSTRVRAVYDMPGEQVVADLRGTKLDVRVDGRSVESRTKDGERAELLTRLGIPQELWSATVHVNGIAGNPIVRGTSASRCQFLEKAFDLDRWADRHQHVADIMAQMRRAQQDLTECRDDLAKLGPAPDVAALQSKLRDLEQRQARADYRARNLSNFLAKVTALPKHPGKSSTEIAAKRMRISERADRAEGFARAHAAWESADERHKQSEALRTSLQQRLSSVLRELKAIAPARGRTAAELTDLARDALRNLRDGERLAEASEAILAWLPVAKRVATKHNMRWRGLRELAALSRTWSDNLKPGSRSCPVCGGDFGKDVDERELNSLRRLTAALPDDVAEVDAIDVKKLHDTADEAVRASKLATDAENLRRDLAAIDNVRVPRRPVGDSRDARRLAEYAGVLREAEGRARQWENAGIDPSVESRVKELSLELNRVDKLSRVLAERTSTIRAELSAAEHSAAGRAVLEKKIARLEGEVSIQPAWAVLRNAYSPTGMRLWLLSELLEALVAGLNEGAPSTRDRVEYGYKLSRNRELSLTASNVRGTFDVRYLSGAESGVFVLSLLTVLLPLLPSSRRSDVLILDEIDANMSAETRSLVAREYIPRLASIVNSLWVVTPSSAAEFSASDANEVLVVKRGGSSYFER